MTQKLFAVYLGGRAPKANTELHDIVFVTGARIEDAYGQMLDKWFGTPQSLHMDGYLELDVVDGYRVSLSPTPDADMTRKLFFVNLGAYKPGIFAELHAVGFYVAAHGTQAKQRARAELLSSDEREIHVDDLYDVDDCIAIDKVNALYVNLSKTGEASKAKMHADYYPLPQEIIADYIAGKKTG